MAGREALGQGHQHTGIDPGALGEAAPPRFADTPAGQHHRLTRVIAPIAAFDHAAGEIDAADMRIRLYQVALAGKHQRVLVVEAGPLDPHEDIARGQRSPRWSQSHSKHHRRRPAA